MPPLATALILFSHGSHLCGASEALEQHAQRIRQRGGYCAVEIGFLNHCEPDFQAAAARCVSAGAKRVIVVPYFLAAGKSVQSALPGLLSGARHAFPQAEFVLAEAIGCSEGMADALLELAAQARPARQRRGEPLGAPKFCVGKQECPLWGSEQCPVSPRKKSEP